MDELMKSINILITNLVKRYLARVEKAVKCYIIPRMLESLAKLSNILDHTAASVKLYIPIYLL